MGFSILVFLCELDALFAFVVVASLSIIHDGQKYNTFTTNAKRGASSCKIEHHSDIAISSLVSQMRMLSIAA
jgi:hypothetical protein